MKGETSEGMQNAIEGMGGAIEGIQSSSGRMR
jgi:hypothetical protein